MTKIILNPTAPARREIDTARMDIVPDLWHIANRLIDQHEIQDSRDVLKTWHLAHDLLNFIKALDASGLDLAAIADHNPEDIPEILDGIEPDPEA